MTITLLSILLLILIILCAWLMRSNSALRDSTTKLSVDKATIEQQLVATQAEVSRLQLQYAETISRHREEAEASQRRMDEEIRQKALADEQDRIRRAKEDELRFKTLASEILGNTQRTFKEQNESRMEEILKPLRDNIDQFRRSIDEKYTREAQERFSLKEKIEELKTLNDSISREARELTTALRGNSKAQGDWGEMILENLLEKSGLEKGREFTVQDMRDASGNTLRDENGHALRPDVVVHYPDGRCVVIDSKVSLTDYVNYCNCDDPDERSRHGRNHIASIRRHIAELSQKNYQDYVGEEKLDFVMMFIPHESAYIAAMQLESNLWQEAYDRRVLIISPTHLISVLKLISQLWSHDRQTRNAIEIATESGKMYDKFVAFVEDMQRIDKAIAASKDAYDKAMNKLSDGSGNLVNRAVKLRKLGAKAAKNLPTQILSNQTDED
ncbi:MAG: DNA recombination protein RmuC [Muribaculaceae bacterium]|nr:DNA recombination protein RmuC [Muribaculaceae bacterium]